jgi:hypothetical protein
MHAHAAATQQCCILALRHLTHASSGSRCGPVNVSRRPLTLPNVVYSPHVYGPSLRSKEAQARGELRYLDSNIFPRNLPQAVTT